MLDEQKKLIQEQHRLEQAQMKTDPKSRKQERGGSFKKARSLKKSFLG